MILFLVVFSFLYCDPRWLAPKGTVVPGTVTKHYPGDTHKKAYEVVLLKCQLQSRVFSKEGGELYVTIDKEEISVYSEKIGSKVPGEVQTT